MHATEKQVKRGGEREKISTPILHVYSTCMSLCIRMYINGAERGEMLSTEIRGIMELDSGPETQKERRLSRGRKLLSRERRGESRQISAHGKSKAGEE